MATQPSLVVYDILRDGIGWAPIFVCLMIPTVGGVLLWLLLRERRHGRPISVVVILLTVWALAGGGGVGNVLCQHARCVAWARSGDYVMTEGCVSDFRPRPRWQHGPAERFTVSGFAFAYGDNLLGEGGYRHAFGPDGLLRDGVRVRVAHRRGRILRLEILGE
jgi:hypothetical protein